MKLKPNLLLSSLSAIMLFLLCFAGIELGVVLSLLFSLGGFAGIFLSLAPKKIDPKLAEIQATYNISPGKIRKIRNQGKKKISVITEIYNKVSDPKVKARVGNILELTKKIFSDFEYDPKDIKAARQFLNYYLDSTIKIIEQYTILSEQKVSDSNKKTLNDVERVLNKIEKAFENQLQKLYEDDFLDLDTEIKVLDSAIQMDDLHK